MSPAQARDVYADVIAGIDDSWNIGVDYGFPGDGRAVIVVMRRRGNLFEFVSMQEFRPRCPLSGLADPA